MEVAFQQALTVFVNNPFDNSLKTHKLSGKLKGLLSFSVSYNIRVVFYFTNEKPQRSIFVNIGDHDEVY
jgi:mRNA-degrading endonuclease YafQ of YafQ-DinJ toxin-antitoxin module